MTLKTKRILLWTAVLAVMVMIFLFSSQNGEESSELSGNVVEVVVETVIPEYEQMPVKKQETIISVLTNFIRKGGHFCEYALLGFFMLLLADSYDLSKRKLAAWGGCTLYAATDELHQLLVSERSGQFSDIMLDSAGGFAGVWAAVLLLWICRRRRLTSQNKP